MLYARVDVLTDKNVSHDCYVFFAIIWWILSYISTSVETGMRSIYAKSNSRVARTTVILFITYDADSCLGTKTIRTDHIEPLHVAFRLQGGLWTN